MKSLDRPKVTGVILWGTWHINLNQSKGVEIFISGPKCWPERLSASWLKIKQTPLLFICLWASHHLSLICPSSQLSLITHLSSISHIAQVSSGYIPLGVVSLCTRGKTRWEQNNLNHSSRVLWLLQPTDTTQHPVFSTQHPPGWKREVTLKKYIFYIHLPLLG